MRHGCGSIERAQYHVVAMLTCASDALYSEKEKYFDYRARLKEITAPTLIIVGERDWICPLSTSSRLLTQRAGLGPCQRLTLSDQSKIMADGIPDSKLLVVKDANHSVHHEKNELVISEIRSFLSSR